MKNKKTGFLWNSEILFWRGIVGYGALVYFDHIDEGINNVRYGTAPYRNLFGFKKIISAKEITDAVNMFPRFYDARRDALRMKIASQTAGKMMEHLTSFIQRVGGPSMETTSKKTLVGVRTSRRKHRKKS